MQTLSSDNWLHVLAAAVAILLVVGVIVIIANLFSGRAPTKRRPDLPRDSGAGSADKPIPPGAPAPAPAEPPPRIEEKRRASRTPEPKAEPEYEVFEERAPEADIAMSAPPAVSPEGFTTVTVHYGTDRNDNGPGAAPNDRFGNDRFIAAAGEAAVQYGTCDVSIPLDHQVGELEDPDWPWQSEDPREHVVLMRINPLDGDAFFQSLGAALGDERHTFIFVHGFNVSFKDAARRTAQIRHDLRFKGACIMYSWPTEQVGFLNPDATAYTEAENNSIWSSFHFTDFLRDVIRRTDAEKVHLVAHSMGNRLVTEALLELRAQLLPEERAKIGEVVLTAADIDAGTFRDHIAPRLVEIVPRVSLYASDQDQALGFSESLHRLPRIGRTNAALAMPVAAVEVVDATAAETDYFGHDYYGTAEAIIADIYLSFHGGLSASERAATLQSIDGSHWRVRTDATMDDVWNSLSETT